MWGGLVGQSYKDVSTIFIHLEFKFFLYMSSMHSLILIPFHSIYFSTPNKDNDHSPESTYSPLVFAGTSSSLETQEA